MTSVKHRSLRNDELDDWFAQEVTKRLFLHLTTDYERLMQARVQGGFFHPGQPQKTNEAFQFSAGQEMVLQQLLDPGHVRERLGSEVEEVDE